ncbi:MAG TPA: AraC family transcriptional regulator [Kofleriaceae bacterium]
MVRGSTVQANSVVKVIDAARQAGLDATALLASVGLGPDQLAVPGARVPFAALVALYEEAARQSGDEAFGLRVGAATHPGMFDVLGHVTMSCANLREAFATIVRYLRVLQEGAVIAVAEDGAVARASYAIVDRDVGPHRHEVEATLGIILRFLEATLGDFTPAHVHFVHAAPRDPSVHAETFRAPVAFGCAANELAFAAALLERPMPRADAALKAILERHILEMLAKMPARGDLVEDVRGCVARMLEHGEPPIDKVARTLAMSGRTLQRRLREHGATFAELLDEVRKDLALRYLADARHETADAAFLLGYSELSTFHRAFRRWTGMSPGEWRRQAIASS